MKFKTSQAAPEPTPKGKRTIRETVWGNTNGYVGGRFWLTIGPTSDVTTKERADRWLATGKTEDDE